MLDGALSANPDPQVALAVLKLAGLADRGAPLGTVGPTTAAAVLDAEIIARRTAADPLMAPLCDGPGCAPCCIARAVVTGRKQHNVSPKRGDVNDGAAPWRQRPDSAGPRSSVPIPPRTRQRPA